ncbi:hypothetical protein [Schlesneria paludicola]|uniref:hypothetical protein n=1 Tax=Schlesneria paludicola TaxID=360056 RepID=UPI0012FC03CC|nr:hypothetical protein [Schlesneria paludicola]
MKMWHRAIWAVVGFWCVASAAVAQDIRVYTQIYDRSKATTSRGAAPVLVAKSLMLFHAGKVYDLIDPGQEVTIYEPALSQFTVLNSQRQLRTELSQSEIRRFLGMAEAEVRKHLGAPFDDSSNVSRKAVEILQFQLRPNFEVTFDEAKLHLSLHAPEFQYVVEGTVPKIENVTEKYLNVADWTAQLNSVLHPQSLLPEPRLALNQEMRQRGIVPKSVELRVGANPEVHLVAKHDWTWGLLETDRQLIADWEKQLQDPKLKRLSFQKFQQVMLTTETAKRR